jgi:hypothetical protein
MIQFRSIFASAAAAHSRAALAGKLEWRRGWSVLLAEALDHLPAVRRLSGTPWDRHWSHPAFVANLAVAAGVPLSNLPGHQGRKDILAHGVLVRNAMSSSALDGRLKVQSLAYQLIHLPRYPILLEAHSLRSIATASCSN